MIPEYGSADASTVEDIAGFMKAHMVTFLQKFDGMDGAEVAEEQVSGYRLPLSPLFRFHARIGA